MIPVQYSQPQLHFLRALKEEEIERLNAVHKKKCILKPSIENSKAFPDLTFFDTELIEFLYSNEEFNEVAWEKPMLQGGVIRHILDGNITYADVDIVIYFRIPALHMLLDLIRTFFKKKLKSCFGMEISEELFDKLYMHQKKMIKDAGGNDITSLVCLGNFQIKCTYVKARYRNHVGEHERLAASFDGTSLLYTHYTAENTFSSEDAKYAEEVFHNRFFYVSHYEEISGLFFRLIHAATHGFFIGALPQLLAHASKEILSSTYPFSKRMVGHLASHYHPDEGFIALLNTLFLLQNIQEEKERAEVVLKMAESLESHDNRLIQEISKFLKKYPDKIFSMLNLIQGMFLYAWFKKNPRISYQDKDHARHISIKGKERILYLQLSDSSLEQFCITFLKEWDSLHNNRDEIQTIFTALSFSIPFSEIGKKTWVQALLNALDESRITKQLSSHFPLQLRRSMLELLFQVGYRTPFEIYSWYAKTLLCHHLETLNADESPHLIQALRFFIQDLREDVPLTAVLSRLNRSLNQIESLKIREDYAEGIKIAVLLLFRKRKIEPTIELAILMNTFLMEVKRLSLISSQGMHKLVRILNQLILRISDREDLRSWIIAFESFKKFPVNIENTVLILKIIHKIAWRKPVEHLLLLKDKLPHAGSKIIFELLQENADPLVLTKAAIGTILIKDKDGFSTIIRSLYESHGLFNKTYKIQGLDESSVSEIATQFILELFEFNAEMAETLFQGIRDRFMPQDLANFHAIFGDHLINKGLYLAAAEQLRLSSELIEHPMPVLKLGARYIQDVSGRVENRVITTVFNQVLTALEKFSKQRFEITVSELLVLNLEIFLEQISKNTTHSKNAYNILKITYQIFPHTLPSETFISHAERWNEVALLNTLLKRFSFKTSFLLCVQGRLTCSLFVSDYESYKKDILFWLEKLFPKSEDLPGKIVEELIIEMGRKNKDLWIDWLWKNAKYTYLLSPQVFNCMLKHASKVVYPLIILAYNTSEFKTLLLSEPCIEKSVPIFFHIALHFAKRNYMPKFSIIMEELVISSNGRISKDTHSEIVDTLYDLLIEHSSENEPSEEFYRACALLEKGIFGEKYKQHAVSLFKKLDRIHDPDKLRKKNHFISLREAISKKMNTPLSEYTSPHQVVEVILKHTSEKDLKMLKESVSRVKKRSKLIDAHDEGSFFNSTDIIHGCLIGGSRGFCTFAYKHLSEVICNNKKEVDAISFFGGLVIPAVNFIGYGSSRGISTLATLCTALFYFILFGLGFSKPATEYGPPLAGLLAGMFVSLISNPDGHLEKIASITSVVSCVIFMTFIVPPS